MLQILQLYTAPTKIWAWMGRCQKFKYSVRFSTNKKELKQTSTGKTTRKIDF